MNLEVRCSSVEVRPTFDHRVIEGVLNGVEPEAIADAMSPSCINDFIQHVGAAVVCEAIDDDDLLEVIGEAAAVRYFGLKLEQGEQ